MNGNRSCVSLVLASAMLFAAWGQCAVGDEPALAVAPFDAETAKNHQRAWANHLRVSVEITNSIGMKLALIPAGEFVMGSAKSEDDRQGDEHQHRVRITKPFLIGTYEVTQEEYAKVMGTNPSHFSATGLARDRVSGQDTARFPVESVSWHDAVKFCRKLSELPEEKAAGRVYLLPTEAEWEYACRAGTTTPFDFGSKLNGDKANCHGNYFPYGTESSGTSLRRTTTVGSYQPNAFGVYDMHGNVWEWCRDWYDEDYYGNSPVDDPPGATTGSQRVRRGGGWIHVPGSCRSAIRLGFWPRHPEIDLGFRVVADLSGERKPAVKEAQSVPDEPDVAPPFGFGVQRFFRATLVKRASDALGEGRVDEAERLYRQVLKSSEDGQKDRYYAACLGGLGRIQLLRDQLSEAEKLLTQALDIFESKFGVDHPLTTESMSNLGSVRFAQGRHAEAEKVWRRTLAIYEKAFGKESPFVAVTLSNLGDVYRATGKVAEAEKHYRRALALNEKLLGCEDRILVVTLSHLADLYTKTDRIAEAEPLLERALKILDKTGFRRKPPADDTLADLGRIRLGQGRLAEGETLLKEAWDIRLREFGREDSTTFRFEYELAEAYMSQAKYAEAEPLARHLLEHWEKASGAESLDAFPSLIQIASIEVAKGQYDSAERLYRRALAISQQAGSHADLAKSMCVAGLARVARRRQKHDEAETGCRELLALAQKALPPDSPHRSDPLHPLALVLHAQGQTVEAEQMYQKWLKAWRKQKPRPQSDAWRQIATRADALAEEGQSSQAESAYWLAFQHAISAHGPDHSDVLALYGKLAGVVRKLGRESEAAAIERLAKDHGRTLVTP